ncbi:MAG TPA: hypothetical protein VGE77_09665 [Nocardioides sp.]
MLIDKVNGDPDLRGALPPMESGGVVPVMTHTTITTTNPTSAGITVNIPTGYAQICILGGNELTD